MFISFDIKFDKKRKTLTFVKAAKKDANTIIYFFTNK